MATTSFLYHTMGVKGYRHVRTEYSGGVIRHHIRLRRYKRRCRGCRAGWHEVTLAGRYERVFVSVPIGRRRQEIVLHGHFQRCRRCGRRLREPVYFSKGAQRYTRSVGDYVLYLCEKATIKDVAEIVGMGWDTVKGIFKSHLRRQLKRRSLADVRVIAVDEFAIRKKQRYLTIVLDLERGRVLWSGAGRRANTLIPFLRKLKRCRAPVQAVAVDMWQPYLVAVKKVFPEATIVHDPFHIVQLVNRAIDNGQRELARLLPKTIRCRRGLRWVILRARETLDERGLTILEELMTINEPLYKAYLLKEDLRQLWSLDSLIVASHFLKQWLDKARQTGLRAFEQLAKTLEKHSTEILNWYQFPISTGPLEGINNKAKVLKRQAYGYRDLEYFQLRLAFIANAKSRFPG